MNQASGHSLHFSQGCLEKTCHMKKKDFLEGLCSLQQCYCYFLLCLYISHDILVFRLIDSLILFDSCFVYDPSHYVFTVFKTLTSNEQSSVTKGSYKCRKIVIGAYIYELSVSQVNERRTQPNYREVSPLKRKNTLLKQIYLRHLNLPKVAGSIVHCHTPA